jgi:hypothetical protein
MLLTALDAIWSAVVCQANHAIASPWSRVQAGGAVEGEHVVERGPAGAAWSWQLAVGRARPVGGVQAKQSAAMMVA